MYSGSRMTAIKKYRKKKSYNGGHLPALKSKNKNEKELSGGQWMLLKRKKRNKISTLAVLQRH